MGRIKPSHLLRLYPRAWRERYGDEFVALLEQEGVPPRVVLNVLGGAFDAWVSPRTPRAARRVAAPAGPMGPQIILLRPGPGARTKEEFRSQFFFGAAVFVTLLGLSLTLHALFGRTWLSDNLAKGSLGLAWCMSFGPVAFRHYPKRTQLAAAFWIGAVTLSVARLLTWLWP